LIGPRWISRYPDENVKKHNRIEENIRVPGESLAVTLPPDSLQERPNICSTPNQTECGILKQNVGKWMHLPQLPHTLTSQLLVNTEGAKHG